MARNIKKVKSAFHGFVKAVRMGLFFALLVSIFLAVPFQSVFAQTGSITGTVRRPGGSPLANAMVWAWPNFVGSWTATISAADGTYTFTGLSAGSYNVQARDQSQFGGYYDQYYDHVDSVGTATAVTVTSGMTTSGIDFDLVEDPLKTNVELGAITNIAAGISYATAVGYKAMVSQSNSLVLGSINGVNGATSSVNVGIGTTAPVRQLHVVGDQAVFRMDRPADTAAFMLVRTDESGNPLKTFVVGANASGSNNGSFVINDLGTGVSGAGTRRLTIDNNGNATFTNSVYAQSFVPASSLVYKTNVKTYENALETVKKLRGVSFDWKESGEPAVGLIAEEVDKVIPAAVAHNDKDATGVNYDSLVGVLVEAVKEQQNHIQKQDEIIQAQQRAIQDLQEQQKLNTALSVKVSELERMLILSNAVSKAD